MTLAEAARTIPLHRYWSVGRTCTQSDTNLVGVYHGGHSLSAIESESRQI